MRTDVNLTAFFTFYLDGKFFRKTAILFGKLAYHHLTDYALNKEKVQTRSAKKEILQKSVCFEEPGNFLKIN